MATDIQPLQVIPTNLFTVKEYQIAISLGDLQKSNIDSKEIIFSTSKMVFELCCKMGGIKSKDETDAKEVIDEILFKYRDMYKAIVDGKKVQDSCDSHSSSDSLEKEDETEEVSSRDLLINNRV